MSNEYIVEGSKHHIMVVNYFMAMRSALFEQFNPGEGTLCQHFHYIYLTIKKNKKKKISQEDFAAYHAKTNSFE